MPPSNRKARRCSSGAARSDETVYGVGFFLCSKERLHKRNTLIVIGVCIPHNGGLYQGGLFATASASEADSALKFRSQGMRKAAR